jgi:hypothetical protein
MKDFEPPAPLKLADALAIHAWSPHVDSQTQTLLGWAADALRRVCRENGRQTRLREIAEHETEMYRRIAYGPQKGGAS